MNYFEDIKDGYTFQELVAAYFRCMEKVNGSLKNVDVQNFGIGPDGEVDLIIKILINDGVRSFERIWIVQCKKSKDTVNRDDIPLDRIGSLLQAKQADGYLLVCTSGISAPLITRLKELHVSPENKYMYDSWSGGEFWYKVNEVPSLVEAFLKISAEKVKMNEAEFEKLFREYSEKFTKGDK